MARPQGREHLAEEWVTLNALADRWGVGRDVVLDLAQRGEIPSRREGRLRLYPESALAVYVESKGLANDEYSDAD